MFSVIFVKNLKTSKFLFNLKKPQGCSPKNEVGGRHKKWLDSKLSHGHKRT